MRVPSQPGHRLFSNAAGVLAARLLVPASNLLLVVALARTLGVETVGQYTLLITTYAVAESLKSLGLGTLVTREVAAQGSAALRYGGGVVRIGLLGAVLAAPAVVAMVAWSAGASPRMTLAAAVISLGLFPSAYVVGSDAVLLALGRADLTAVGAATEGAVRLAGSLLVLSFWSGDLILLASVYAAGRGVGAGMGRAMLRRQGVSLVRPAPALVREMLRRSPAYMTIFALPILLFRLDVLFLSWIEGEVALGTYASAMRLFTVALILPDSVLTALFPQFSRAAAREGGEGLVRLLERTTRLVGITLIPLSVLSLVAAPWAVALVFGEGFEASAPVLQLLMWGPVLFAVNRAVGDALVASGRERAVAGAIVAALIASPPIFYFLIRSHSSPGAALALVCCIGVLCFLSLSQAVLAGLVRTPTAFVGPVGAAVGAAIAWNFNRHPSLRLVLTVATCTAVVVPPLLAEMRARHPLDLPDEASPP
jgi:O-antigen/teichoic acid export membrane protein